MIDHLRAIITPVQFGFRQSHSTIHCILNFLNNISSNKEKDYHCAVFIDLKKAFDTVPHDILVSKLENYGITGNSLDWFKSYLEGRYQATKVRKVMSNMDLILCGVPQGSILGPLLFLIYINDLPDATSLLCSLFADDTTLQYNGDTIEDLQNTVNIELTKASKWFMDNRLSLHPKKTNVMVFKLRKNKKLDRNKINLVLNGVPLEQCGANYQNKSIKFLGIMIDSNLDWGEHINYVSNKLRKIIFSLKQVKKIFPFKLRVQLFKSLFMPHLEYGLEAFGSAKGIGRLSKLQKWGMRTAANSKYNAHTEPLFKANNILKVEDLYKLKCRTLIRAKIDNETPVAISNMFIYHEKKNRKHHCIEQHFPCNKIIDSLPSYIIPRIWNNDRPTDLNASVRIFKSNQKNQLLTCI